MPQPSVHACVDLPDFTDVLEGSKKILRHCFKQFHLDEVFLSFNGGKDCTALLDLTIDVLQEIYKRDNIAKELKVVYIRTNGPFREIETFVKEIEGHYGVKLKVIEGGLKETLQRLVEQDGRLKACLMGTRRSDPYSSDLKHMQNTDPSWPPLLRVCPLLDWGYHQVWSYMLRRRVPYCCLYDKGYTSIGSVQNTWPNPSLAYTTGRGPAYRPAWCLADASAERAGRGVQPPNQANGQPPSHANGQPNGHIEDKCLHVHSDGQCSQTNGSVVRCEQSSLQANGGDVCSDESCPQTNGVGVRSDEKWLQANGGDEKLHRMNGAVL